MLLFFAFDKIRGSSMRMPTFSCNALHIRFFHSGKMRELDQYGYAKYKHGNSQDLAARTEQSEVALKLRLKKKPAVL